MKALNPKAFRLIGGMPIGGDILFLPAIPVNKFPRQSFMLDAKKESGNCAPFLLAKKLINRCSYVKQRTHALRVSANLVALDQSPCLESPNQTRSRPRY